MQRLLRRLTLLRGLCSGTAGRVSLLGRCAAAPVLVQAPELFALQVDFEKSQGLLCKTIGVRLILNIHMLDPTVGSGV
jgi:hypothetical protein